ncbi:uncharacterized protein LOC100571675 isoform X3 [Acyrthosiphon pisum]|uniref:Uncharacterized protein n=1 Tax=Acyrthosiphon pisum TaxID=7029 RepID=A0A8R2JLU2_ACYPI|nr:uncharacterized protein LOC100571675 isoform X3 [Acyrthosiphon pisum]
MLRVLHMYMSYDVLANGAFVNKEYENAKDIFTKVIEQLIEQGGPKNYLNILHIGLKISKIYEVQKDYKTMITMLLIKHYIRL